MPDLNRRPHAPHACALANCANPRNAYYKQKIIFDKEIKTDLFNRPVLKILNP